MSTGFTEIITISVTTCKHIYMFTYIIVKYDEIYYRYLFHNIICVLRIHYLMHYIYTYLSFFMNTGFTFKVLAVCAVSIATHKLLHIFM